MKHARLGEADVIIIVVVMEETKVARMDRGESERKRVKRRYREES